MLCILLSQKLVLVKVVTLHIPIIGKWIIRDGGAKMDITQIRWNVVNKPYIVLLKEYGLEWYSLFSMDPPQGFGDLKLQSSPFFSFCLCAGQFFFYSIAPCLLSLKDFGGYVQDMVGVIILKGHICGQDIKDTRTK